MSIDRLIEKNRITLSQMIKNDFDKEEILKQSQKLDKYIAIKMKKLNS